MRCLTRVVGVKVIGKRWAINLPYLPDEQRTDGVQPLVELGAIQRLQHDVLVWRHDDDRSTQLQQTTQGNDGTAIIDDNASVLASDNGIASFFLSWTSFHP